MVRTSEDVKMTAEVKQEPTSEEIAEQKKKQEEEKKARAKQTIMKLFLQMKAGCKKEICFNKYCVKNHFRKFKPSYDKFWPIEKQALIYASD